jgi:spore germination protein KC
MRKIGVALLLVSVVLLNGCWDIREINDLGLVMAVGVDKVKIPISTR